MSQRIDESKKGIESETDGLEDSIDKLMSDTSLSYSQKRERIQAILEAYTNLKIHLKGQ